MEGLYNFWTVISAFFDSLPAELLLFVTFPFACFVVVSIVGWFK